MTNEVTVAERAAPGVRADGVLATVGVAGKAADMTVLLRKPEPADQDCAASGFFAGQGTPRGGAAVTTAWLFWVTQEMAEPEG
eukprot:2168222-Alexandrium_andersonii.AAC.1